MLYLEICIYLETFNYQIWRVIYIWFDTYKSIITHILYASTTKAVYFVLIMTREESKS